MGQAISQLTIKGFKSIRCLENFKLHNLNILIGPNGAGKSNFVNYFRFLRAVVEGNMQTYLGTKGGSFVHLYFGPKVTPQLYAEMKFGCNAYEFMLNPTQDNRFLFQEERIQYDGSAGYLPVNRSIGRGHLESLLNQQLNPGNKNIYVAGYIYESISSWIVYHFHDTSDFAKVKLPCSKQDYEYLRPDASNLSAFLLNLRANNQEVYTSIRDTIRLGIDFFDDFLTRDYFNNPQETAIEWRQKGSDYPFQPSQFSDGSLRFICLVTALLQPNPPSTILLDEPELGLHPNALALLAGLIKKASKQTQVIVSTQSATLLDHFQPEDIVLVDRKDNESVFTRPDVEKLKIWLEDYSLGAVWGRNIIEGLSVNE